jgi:hypothetical protein
MTRLAPFYDLVCTRAIKHLYSTLALSIGQQKNPDNMLMIDRYELAKHATANACGAPAVLSLSFATQPGVAHIIPMTRRDVGRLCIFTTQKALRENAQPYRFWGLLDSCLAAYESDNGFAENSDFLGEFSQVAVKQAQKGLR